jgi:pimeloyl-ACP methyl ester carboxylesterase
MAISARTIQTSRLAVHARISGQEGGTPVILLHGNVSSGIFFEDLMNAFPAGYFVVAPDFRGYGDSETKALDATRGLRDLSEDLRALVEALGLAGRPAHLLGWSVGSGVAMQYALDHSAEVASLILEAPMSPFGFGGTKGLDGAAIFPDFAGTGGGTANPEFVKRLSEKDEGDSSDFSPRKVMNAFYFKPPFRSPHEDAYVNAMIKTAVAPSNYPGDLTTSPNWPTVAPGTQGINNAISGKYCNLSGLAKLSPQPPILWVRGDSDQIVSDTSLFDFGYLGQLGAVPGWPGAEVYPPQPMVSQMRAVLDAYQANGGKYREVVFANCGHSPHLENVAEFNEIFFGFLASAK